MCAIHKSVAKAGPAPPGAPAAVSRTNRLYLFLFCANKKLRI